MRHNSRKRNRSDNNEGIVLPCSSETTCLTPKCGAVIAQQRSYVTVRRNPKRKCQLVSHSVGNQVVPSITSASNNAVGEYCEVDLYTAYLGKVTVSVYDFKTGSVALQTTVNNIHNKDTPIYVKCIDGKANRISMDRQYEIRYLAQVSPTNINIAENKRTWDELQTVGNNHVRRHALLTTLNAVDIHFMTCNWIEFMQKELSINSMNNDGVLVSIHNYDRLDNAFNTGKYMIYGNGDKLFFPMGCIDVTGHELVHGLTETLAGLKYEGESGALNEHFSDVVGVAFEHWMYRKYNDNENDNDNILGEFDWFMGEDIGRGMRYLRNFKDPTNAPQPQPKKYKGQYWVDTSNISPQNDYGGVHTNSGVPNHCFYLYTCKVGIYEALRTFVKVLRKMKPTSRFDDFARELNEQSSDKNKSIAKEVLSVVGL